MDIDLLTIIHLHRIRRARRPRIQRPLRDMNNIFDWPQNQFKVVFRLSKEMAWEVIEAVRPQLAVPQKATDLSAEIKVLTALRFYAQGSYQLSVARDTALNMCQKSVSNCLTQVTNAIVDRLADTWIKFPSINEIPYIRAKFHQQYGLPGFMGCIDCTHVQIVSPSDEHLYVNRKGGHSLNVQLICDADCRITNVNARFPGSTHDAFIWKQSLARNHLFQLYRSGTLGSSWLAGDAVSGQRIRARIAQSIV